jgi:hypothetical protein
MTIEWKEEQMEIALARNHQNFSVKKNNEWCWVT